MNNEIVTINDLSDDNLSRILSRINIIERQRLEIVCKRWQLIIRRMWSTKRKLFITMKPEDDTHPKCNIQEFPGGLRGDLHSCTALASIIKLCAENITDFHLKITYQIPDHLLPTEVYDLLFSNENLRSFAISGEIEGITERCVIRMPTKCLQELTIWKEGDWFGDDSMGFVEQVLPEIPGLVSLKLSEVSSYIIETIEKMSELKLLNLGGLRFQKDKLFLNTAKLVNLEVLEIFDDDVVDDRFLFELVKNCKLLRVLTFPSKLITNIGLKAISGLANLRCIVLSEVEGFELLNYFSNMGDFRCVLSLQCQVPEEVLLNFYLRSPNLKICRLGENSIQQLFNKIAIGAGSTLDFSYAQIFP